MHKQYSVRWIALSLLLGLMIPLLWKQAAGAEGMSAPIPRNIKFETVVSGLVSPLYMTHAGDGSNRMFIVQRGGLIRIYKNGALNGTPFLDVSGLLALGGGEQGLLGLAFDPNYEVNGRFYITYTAQSYDVTLARYTVSANPDIANPTGEVLLSIPKTRTNHNGGMIAFGPDSHLYMSVGDGGGTGDPDNNAQDRTVLLGKILRLDVSGPGAYAIPPSNPFYNNPNPDIKKEIWSYGLRNPWRFSFDRATGDLYIADVGQDAQEEIDFQQAGAAGGQNFGWRVMEGNLCYLSSACTPPAGYVPPVFVYDHGQNDSNGCSVTGGYVYRGPGFPALTGAYLFADFCRGKLWGMNRGAGNQWATSLLADTSFLISSFGEDEQGELYLLDYSSGSLIHLAKAEVLTKTYWSRADLDGHILEIGEFFSRGGYFSSTALTLFLGDDAQDRQFRAFLTFPTASLPDNAVVLSATIKLKQKSIMGTNPFSTHGRLVADIGQPYFGTGVQLEAVDFQSLANGVVATFNTNPSNNWYFAQFALSALPKINRVGPTQLRLRFQLDDNDDMSRDTIEFISGNSLLLTEQPVLVITYFIP